MIFDVTGKLEFVCRPHMRTVAVNGLRSTLANLVSEKCIMDLSVETPYLSTPTESTPESSPVKICSLKSLPGEKHLDFFSRRQYSVT